MSEEAEHDHSTPAELLELHELLELDGQIAVPDMLDARRIKNGDE